MFPLYINGTGQGRRQQPAEGRGAVCGHGVKVEWCEPRGSGSSWPAARALQGHWHKWDPTVPALRCLKAHQRVHKCRPLAGSSQPSPVAVEHPIHGSQPQNCDFCLEAVGKVQRMTLWRNSLPRENFTIFRQKGWQGHWGHCQCCLSMVQTPSPPQQVSSPRERTDEVVQLLVY